MNFRYVVVCPWCNHPRVYKSWFDWMLHTPFHFFSKRRVVCNKCNRAFYTKPRKVSWY